MKIEFNRVTWYSKLAAAIVIFGMFPAICFHIGREFQEVMRQSEELEAIAASLENHHYKNSHTIDVTYAKESLAGTRITNLATNTIFRYSISAPTKGYVALKEEKFVLNGPRWTTPVLTVLDASGTQINQFTNNVNWTEGSDVVFNLTDLLIPAGETYSFELKVRVNSPASCFGFETSHFVLGAETIAPTDETGVACTL